MKKINFCCALYIILFVLPITAMNIKRQEQNDSYIVKKTRIGASFCTLLGGWGFFTVNSPYFMNKLSYNTKRIPLAVFLVGCSVNQAFIIREVMQNE